LLTVVDPPLSPPPLSTPAGAERGANSRIWPCLFREDVHGLGQHHVYGWGGLGETCLEGRMCSDLRHFWDGAGGYSNWDHNSGDTPQTALPFPYRFTRYRANVIVTDEVPRTTTTFPHWFTPKQSSSDPNQPPPASSPHRPQAQTAGTSSLKTHGQIWLFGSPFRPGGGGKGLGDRGGLQKYP
jgi:hypothetical protein